MGKEYSESSLVAQVDDLMKIHNLSDVEALDVLEIRGYHPQMPLSQAVALYKLGVSRQLSAEDREEIERMTGQTGLPSWYHPVREDSSNQAYVEDDRVAAAQLQILGMHITRNPNGVACI